MYAFTAVSHPLIHAPMSLGVLGTGQAGIGDNAVPMPWSSATI